MKSVSIFLLSLAFALPSWATMPQPPADPEHPGSLMYSYELQREKINVDGRDVEVFLPVGAENVPVIVYGKGQALKVDSYDETFEHLARKGYAVIFPQYDTGFFDQDWKRMGRDFASLAEKTIERYSTRMNLEAVVFSGHSKGAYVALTAAGVPRDEGLLRPQALVLFNLAGYESDWVKNVDADVPVTLTWSDEDSIIKESLVREVYAALPSEKSQLITLKSYSNREADHFFPTNKGGFFGGQDGISAFHYYGTWKWLIGAADDIQMKTGVTNEYIYGEKAGLTGANFEHQVERKFSDILIFLDEQADLSQAPKIQNREERLRYVYSKLTAVASKSQGQVLRLLHSKNFQTQSFYIANAILVKSVSESDQLWLKQLQQVRLATVDVEAVLDDFEVTFPIEIQSSIPSNISKINAHRVWEELGVRGEGIVIAGQDTGFDWTHPAIVKQYRGVDGHDYHWLDATVDNSPVPTDDSGHGTHTMGSMLGDGGADRRIGVAPGAEWMGCRNMKGGVGKPSTYLTCFQFFLAPYPISGNPAKDGRPELAPHIINNSWSCPGSEGCEGEELLGAVRAMKAAGIFVVVAAGNDGDRCATVMDPPAMYSGEVFSVGAYNTFISELAWFSSRGPSTWNGAVGVDLVAPGAPVTSSVPGGGYEGKMGTSMASPHVAGAVALLWSYKPEYIGDIEATVKRLHQTALPKRAQQSCGPFKGGDIPNTSWGYGFLDAYKLLTD